MHAFASLLSRRALLVLLAGSALAGSAGCYRRPRPEVGDAPVGEQPRGRGTRTPNPLDPTAVYAQAGLLAESDPIPFVGNVRYLAGRSPDSTLVFLTLSLANRALTFAGEGDGQQAKYQVTVDFRQGSTTVKHFDSREVVRVGSFRETSRSDESVIFQQFIPAAPGQYVLAVAVRDEGSARNGQHEMLLAIPRLATRALSSPIPVYQASPRTTTDSLPELIANPRATVIFGRDSVARLYIEGYGLAPNTPVVLAALGDRNAVIWRDTVPLGVGGALQANVLTIPVSQLGVGRLTIAASTQDGADTVRTPLFVTFGDEWAIASFDEMLNYLRYFVSPSRLAELRGASPETRAAVWGAFYKQSDPDPATPEHEGLRDYFNRLQQANERFREEGTPGWLSDRGRVFVTLGEPDQVLEQGESNMSQRGRAQIWAYAQYRLQLVFVDQTGFGRWRLTSSSENDFITVANRERR
ncbi:MAG: GWxTD domain-containing protein [Gemmatimonadaceae bacterium]